MIAKDRGRQFGRLVLALTAMGSLAPVAEARQLRGSRTAPAAPAATPRANNGEAGQLQMVKVPVNPNDAIAVINNEVITRQQLADECVAREGTKILEAMVARRLIEQSMKSQKLEITAAEIDAEIDSVAQRVAGVGREAWLRTLDKERGISPAQYARDIIYPSIALRKLASPRVQVTPTDIKDAFEANFGERLHCRLIMVKDQRTAIEIWEQLKKNPGGFEKLAKERSMDESTRALGGLLPEPMARHAFPRSISDAAYQQLVDGDTKDLDPSHKPKDGDFSGPIQVNESAWLIVRREKLDPPKNQDSNNPQIKKMLESQMFEVKLKEAMTEVFNEMLRGAKIENFLTGTSKEANEEKMADSRVDGNVKLMGGEGPGRASTQPQPAAGVPARPLKAPATPAGVPAEALKEAEAAQQSLGRRPASAPPVAPAQAPAPK